MMDLNVLQRGCATEALSRSFSLQRRQSMAHREGVDLTVSEQSSERRIPEQDPVLGFEVLVFLEGSDRKCDEFPSIEWEFNDGDAQIDKVEQERLVAKAQSQSHRLHHSWNHPLKFLPLDSADKILLQGQCKLKRCASFSQYLSDLASTSSSGCEQR